MLLIARSYVGGNVFLSSKLLLWGNLLRTISSFSHSLFRFLTHSNSLSLSLSFPDSLSHLREVFENRAHQKQSRVLVKERAGKRGRGSRGVAVTASVHLSRSIESNSSSVDMKGLHWSDKKNNNTVDSSPSFPHPSSANVQLRLEQHCSDLAGNILKLLNCRQAWIPGCHSDQSLRQRFCAMQHEYTWASLGLTDAR